MRSLRTRAVAADIAAVVATIMIAAAKVKIIANAKNITMNIIMNTVKANAIAMNILMNITIMMNMLSKPIA